MVKKYYIRIDENEPVSVTNGVYFVIEEDTTNDATEFYLVRKNEYQTLLSRFNAFENEVTSEVQGIVDAYLQGGRTLERTQSAFQLISSNGENSITYQQLATAMAKIDGNHNHNSTQVKNTSALSNIGSVANTTQSVINDKINTKMGDFQSFIDGFQFKRCTNTFGAYFEIWFNDYFVFFRIGENMGWSKGNKTNSNANVWTELDSNIVIPNSYQHTNSSERIDLRPPSRIIFDSHIYPIKYMIQTNGKFFYQISKELTSDTNQEYEGSVVWVRRSQLGLEG